MRVVSFRVADVRGGVDATAVREIARMVDVTPLPGAPAPVEGVIVVRGALVPVLDLRARLALPPRAAAPTDYLVVVAAAAATVALRVDDVDDVRDVPDDAIERAHGMVAAAATVAGVARLDDGLLVVHDVDAFLSQAEADAIARALHAHATHAHAAAAPRG